MIGAGAVVESIHTGRRGTVTNDPAPAGRVAVRLSSYELVYVPLARLRVVEPDAVHTSKRG